MQPMSELISVAEAQRLVLERVKPIEAERVPIERAAGRVLAEAALAAVDLPPFPSSAMDGFALRSGDTAGGAAWAPVPRGGPPGGPPARAPPPPPGGVVQRPPASPSSPPPPSSPRRGSRWHRGRSTSRTGSSSRPPARRP